MGTPKMPQEKEIMEDIEHTDRIAHIFKFIDLEKLTDKQITLIESFESYFNHNHTLTDRQYEILENIYEQSQQ